MTRNMIFGSAIGAIVVIMAVASLFVDKSNYDHERKGFNVEVDVDIDGDEIRIVTVDGRTVAYTKDGKIECNAGDDDITITREDGSQTKIAC